MIVGCYSTHLYCEICNQFGEYTGETLRETLAKARKDGWKTFEIDRQAFCPTHQDKAKAWREAR